MTDELVIRKSIVVQRPADDAFRIFTEGMGDWWPFRSYSIFEDRSETVVLEARVGGRVYERSTSGEEGAWGTVTAWEPPHRFAMTWHPGNEAETATELEVRFSPEGDGTRVDLVHTGWERLGDRMAESMSQYEKGWDLVLGSYASSLES